MYAMMLECFKAELVNFAIGSATLLMITLMVIGACTVVKAVAK